MKDFMKTEEFSKAVDCLVSAWFAEEAGDSGADEVKGYRRWTEIAAADCGADLDELRKEARAEARKQYKELV